MVKEVYATAHVNGMVPLMLDRILNVPKAKTGAMQVDTYAV